MSNQPTKVIFAPGALEQMEADIPTDELQTVLDDIKALFSGDMERLAGSTLIDMDELLEEDPELHALLSKRLEELGDLADLQPQKLDS